MDNTFYFIILILTSILIYNYFDTRVISEEFSNTTENFIIDKNLLDNYKGLPHIKKLIKNIHDIFDTRNIRYWIHTEALLGAVKNKGILPWEDNIDIGVLIDDEEKIINLRKLLKKKNLGISEWFGGYKIFNLDGIEIKGTDYKYPYINILLFKKTISQIILNSQTALKIWPNETYPKDDIFPLRVYNFENYQVYGPNNAEKVLDKIYKNWNKENIKIYQQLKYRSYNKKNNLIEYNVLTKPFLWQYWDNIDDKKTPAYISLCLKSVDKYCSKSFNIVRLNKDNIFTFIPELEKYKTKMEKLIIAHKVDIYRIFLLYKYGGIYMDADIICLRNPIEIIDKLDQHEFVGFGCTGQECKMGYGKPSNWIMASRPNGILMGKVLENILSKLQSKKEYTYHDLGKLIIWEELENLINNDKFEYYHYPNKIDGSRDINGRWVDSNIVFANEEIKYEDEKNMMFFVFYNSEIPKEIKSLTEEELIHQDWNYSKFIRRALSLN
jgi:phosphorylcholine metabolism protein LicD